jgi:hypothetical protein
LALNEKLFLDKSALDCFLPKDMRLRHWLVQFVKMAWPTARQKWGPGCDLKLFV